MARYRQLNHNEPLQIGDVVIENHPLGGKRKYTITRRTAQFSFAKAREDYEVKYPGIFESYFQSLPRAKWNQTDYSVYRPVDEGVKV